MVWPLADLFEALRREGFQLRPDDYREVVQVLDTFQPRSPADLQALITPLIVTSEEEQEKFDRIFWRVWQDEGLKPHTAETKPDKPEKDVPWLWIATGLLALLVLAYVAFLWPAPTFRSDIQLIYGSVGPIEVGDTLVFSVDSSLQQAAGSRARWRWETPEGKPYPKAGEPALGVIAQHTGPHRVKLRSQRGRGLLFTTWTDSLRGVEFTVCNKLPVIQINRVQLDSSSQRVRYRFSARVIQPSTSQLTQWQFDGGVVAQNQNTWEHTFQTSVASAYHDIRFRAFLDTTQQLCYGEAGLTVHIPVANKPSFTVDIRQTGNLIVPKTQLDRRYYWALWVLGILLILLIGYYIWLVDRDRRKKKSESPLLADPDNPLARFTSDEPPLEIPLENRDAELITRDQLFYQLVRMLRQPTESELQRLHVARTMQATMHEGGFPTLMFQARLVETEYLFLIDRSQVRSQQVALFEYLFRAFVGENVCVERFFFHKTFDRFTNETHPKGLSLRQLTDAYHHQTLLIWSNGSPLLYPPYPVVEPAIREALTDWESRAILTPVPFADWGSKERALQADFLLLPADLTGQLRLIQALQEKQTHQDTYLRQQTNDLYSTEYVEFQEIDELREYLGEALFQWLAALALYPRIRWEIVVEMGRALLPPEAVNFTNLLKLARISWMHEGSFPDYTRLELLKALRPENEAKARQTLLRMLNYAEQYFPGEHVYDGEKYLLQTVNQFTLYVHDPDTFTDYQPAQEEFKKLYEQGYFPDGATLRYLENPGGQWATLLPAEGIPIVTSSTINQPESLSLQAYFNNLPVPTVNEPDQLIDEPTKRDPKQLYVLGAILLLLPILAGIWYTSTRPQNQVQDLNQLVPITIVLEPSACVTVVNTNPNPEILERGYRRWMVFINDSLYDINNLHATRSFLLTNLTSGSATDFKDRTSIMNLQATVSVKDTTGREQVTTVPLTSDTLRVRIDCPVASTVSANTSRDRTSTDKPVQARPSTVSSNTTAKASPSLFRVFIEYTDPSKENLDRAQAFRNRLSLQTNPSYKVIGLRQSAEYIAGSAVLYFSNQDKRAAETLASQAEKELGTPFSVRQLNGALMDGYTCPPFCEGEDAASLPGLKVFINYGKTSKPQSQTTNANPVQQTAPATNAYELNVNQTNMAVQTRGQSETENARITSLNVKDETVQKGIDAYRRGQLEEAIKLYDQALGRNSDGTYNLLPNSAYILDLKGYSLFRLKRYDEAVTILFTAMKADPNFAWIYFDLARVYCAIGKSYEASEAIRQAIKLQPNIQTIMQNDKEFSDLCGRGATAK